MPLPFAGSATSLATGDIDRAARELGVLREAVIAVLTVETGGVGGFLSDGSGRPRILFEAKRFGDTTAHKWDAEHPLISCRVNNWKLYKGGAAEYERLAEAAALDASAAIEAASWGLFQVMGSNWELLGYRDAAAMAAGMAESEGNQLEAFVIFCQRNYLVSALRGLEWARFARGYNGPAYDVNHYDTRLADAFKLAAAAPVTAGWGPRIGMKSDAIAALQAALNAAGFACGAADGQFGRVTELALRRFQSARGLVVDGIAGPASMKALGLVRA